MASINFPGVSQETVSASARALETLAQRYQSDVAFRRELDLDAEKVLRTYGFEFPPGVAVKVAADTPELMHLILPGNPNVELSDDVLDTLAGGAATASTASTVMTFCCYCAPSTISTVGSGSTVGSA